MADGWGDRRTEPTDSEARIVLDHQLSTISDIDDKAVRTVRVTVILIGIIGTGVQVAGGAAFNSNLLVGGGAALFGALLMGLLTYSESSLYMGPNQDYLHQLATDRFYGNEWDEDLLMTMAVWITENHDDIARNGRLLTLTQAFLALGVLLVGASVGF